MDTKTAYEIAALAAGYIAAERVKARAKGAATKALKAATKYCWERETYMFLARDSAVVKRNDAAYAAYRSAAAKCGAAKRALRRAVEDVR